MLVGEEDDARVDHIGGTCCSTQVPSCFRHPKVKIVHLYLVGCEQPHKANLTGRVAPNLSDHTDRHVHLLSEFQQSHDPPVHALEGN